MTDFEKQIWAAAYSAKFIHDYEFFSLHGRDGTPFDRVDGYSCAEVADVAVQKFRVAMDHPDKDYLMPVREGVK